MPKIFIFVIFFCALFLSSPSFAAQITSKEFLATDFIKSFQKKEYDKALKESDALLKKHPNDALILRYRALTLEKLKQPKKAIKLYQEILAAHPDDIPARLFLGLAYVKKDEYAKAEEELRFVAKHASSEEYRHWAQAQLNRLHRNVRTAAKPVKKKAYVVGKTGIFYDSNPLLLPDNKALLAKSKKAAALYVFELTAGYPLRLEKDSRLDILYIGQQYSHSHGAGEVDFTSQGFALDAKKRTFIGTRSFLLGSRYGFRANFLRSDLFSIVNRFFVSADTSFWPRTQTHFYGRFGILNYGPDGANPDQTSRDGIREGIGATQYFYTSDLKSFFFIKGEANSNQTRGDNFNRNGALARVGIHTPLYFCKKTDLDISSGFDWGAYPDFVSLSALDLTERHDKRRDVYTGVTHHWKPNVATRIFYRFINSENDSDLYDRTRHITGMEAVFSF
ncbi:MAG: tetratricopeptide repeat protein [Candidatus Omnitrophica bacterium]|nr:tetratricopeptide repeat protein [Candidatus Omnitrophota bacterium]